MSTTRAFFAHLAVGLAAVQVAAAGEFGVVAVEPAAHSLTAPVAAPITVHFDQPVLPASITSDSFWAFGRWSGTVQGTYSFSNGDQTVSLHPDEPLFYGEQVMVILSHDIQAAGGDPLRSAGFSWQFWTAAMPSAMSFTFLDQITTRTIPQQSSRAYGGIATDLNNDGWADLTIVNEDTADLRVFLNLADGSGMFADFMQPTSPVNDRASPSEPSDFNHDGHADICVANINTGSVSILLGLGDGRYGPQQEITVGFAPRGIAVLDADGDGDIDIVNTNSSSSNLSILLNDGTGVFGAPTFFEGGGISEWALMSGDMNDDGILDLVVGARTSQTIIINTGNGNGTFTPQSPQSAGGSVWMLVVGDVDGNGTEDVATANSSTNNGAILLGLGDGTLAPPMTHATDPFPLATDLGDIDGDGDLDWVTSSFGGDWWLFENDGGGGFTFREEFDSPVAASCALMVDIDNDRDLDLVLIDEIADVVVLMKNSGTVKLGDLDGDCAVTAADLAILLGNWGPCPPDQPCPADLNGDGTVGAADLAQLLGNWGPCL
ncbi:MAG: VCBS repeat-containing protein [Planctomycetes bacterium]|nr:VCBS repeat-containing protein [Planctomycetota bacterium]